MKFYQQDVSAQSNNILVFSPILQGVCGGILRGSGRQHIGAAIVFIGYAIGLPVGIYFMFKTSLRVSGRKLKYL